MNQRAHPHSTSLTQPPPHLYGRWHRDPILTVGTAFMRAWWPAWRPLSPLRPAPVNPGITQVRIVNREVVAHDENVIALTLAAAEGGMLPSWHAGAHVDVLLPSGRMREYSLCGDPTDREHYRIAVRRIPDGGGGSIEVHDALTIGEVVSIKGPRNAFPLAVPGHGSPARRLRFIAAGIGITPILPMLAVAERFGLDWSMIYTGRSADSIPFLDEVAKFGDRITIRTDDQHGLPTMSELVGPVPDSDADLAVYCCGPVPMLENLRRHLCDRADIELHYERFSPPPVENGSPFTVTLASTGARIPVAADESALAAIRRVMPSVPYSCQQGFCGTCKVRTLSGDIDHRDNILTEPEREAGTMLTCVSRSAGGNLTLDL
ncbi:PDR/VanB family oxidoreductase [Gordonia rubripertincta]|uniref:PDR/VanB family oxidoreductase n=2 Tax=Gordonia rubripertincta TaxID=36822 RepID=A0AAW6RG94_GORRU|nr:PDR/VanB family oxidoreductase [Gordonia rubripertincta]MDG6783551.1 PDR/VanB family oxidoreductase [Gordonia rubripertincta]NKY65675.1 oxidoreductase [Gordonia rubripertincta]GAB84276.1 putative oxidoreductase [Gordonia rubripertincta NBRC 101908]